MLAAQWLIHWLWPFWRCLHTRSIEHYNLVYWPGDTEFRTLEFSLACHTRLNWRQVDAKLGGPWVSSSSRTGVPVPPEVCFLLVLAPIQPLNIWNIKLRACENPFPIRPWLQPLHFGKEEVFSHITGQKVGHQVSHLLDVLLFSGLCAFLLPKHHDSTLWLWILLLPTASWCRIL